MLYTACFHVRILYVVLGQRKTSVGSRTSRILSFLSIRRLMNEKLDAAVQIARDLSDRLRDAGLAGAKVALRTRLWDEVPKFAQPDLARIVVREGANVGNVHAIHALANPERLALVDDRYAWDFVETNDKINQVCHAFTRLVPRGTRPRVVLCMENRVEYALVWFALFRLGWPAVHASNAATVEEAAFLFESSGAVIAVGSESTRACLEAAAPKNCTVLSVDTPPKGSRALDFHRHIAGFARTHFRRERSASGENVVYTSGTTGKPKGAVRDFGSMGLMELVEILERMPITLQERHLVVSKLYHSAGQAFTLIMAALGATIFIEDQFDPEKLLQSIHQNEITSMFMVPTMISRVTQLDDAVFQKYPPRHLKTIISGAGMFSHALRERAIARFGAEAIHDFYGASELGWVTLISGTEMLERKNSQGRALRGQEIRIVDGKKVLPPGEIGLIQVRTQTRMEGYLGDQESSDEILSEDGWMTVDDTGYLDEDGYLYLAGRARDMIISGGVNIYPAEIEEVLIRHEGVTEVSVVGAPDDDWGEKLVGFVAGDADLDPLAIESWARDFIAGYKIPRVWYRVDALPRNPTGKVLKKDLEVVAAADGKPDKDASDIAKQVAKNATKIEREKSVKKSDAKPAEDPVAAKASQAVKTDASAKKTAEQAEAKKSAPSSTKKTSKPQAAADEKAAAKADGGQKSAAKAAVEPKPAAKAPKTTKKAAATSTKTVAKKTTKKKSADTARPATQPKPSAKTTKAEAETKAGVDSKAAAAEEKAAAEKATKPAAKKAAAKKTPAKSTKPRTPKTARSPKAARKK